MAMNVDTGMQVRIESQNVLSTLQHKTRDLEVEELPNYLRVVPEAPESLMLVNVQEAEPGVSLRPYPWIKLDANGYPVADPIYVWHAVDDAWVNAAP